MSDSVDELYCGYIPNVFLRGLCVFGRRSARRFAQDEEFLLLAAIMQPADDAPIHAAQLGKARSPEGTSCQRPDEFSKI